MAARNGELWRVGAPTARADVVRRPWRVLMLYLHASAEPMRPTTLQHLRFLDWSTAGHEVVYWNVAHRPPRFVREAGYDVVLLHYSAMCARWEPGIAFWGDAPSWLPGLDAVTVAMPQDEYDYAAVMDDWIVESGIDVVYSVLAPEHWPIIYPRASRVAQMEKTLTGFVDDTALGRLTPRPHGERSIDVAYRARALPYRIGSHGQLKHRLAEIVRPRAEAAGLRTDISTAFRATKYGDDWYAFLGDARCVIGCESGSSGLDPRGEVRAAEAAFRAERPDATFEEFRATQAPGWDDHRFTAISPRIFEAAMTKSCQVLVEGAYDGALEPEEHYVPLRHDLANLDEALERIRDDRFTEQVAERAWRDVVLSGRWGHGAFAADVERALEPLVARRSPAAGRALRPTAVAARTWNLALVRPPRFAVRVGGKVSPRVGVLAQRLRAKTARG